MSKVVGLLDEGFLFDDGFKLESEHEADCCEHHYLSTDDLTLEDFEYLEFNLDIEGGFFNRIEGYGIELVPINGWSVKVPGYGDNNGYYSSQLNLSLRKDGKEVANWDITECQDY